MPHSSLQMKVYVKNKNSLRLLKIKSLLLIWVISVITRQKQLNLHVDIKMCHMVLKPLCVYADLTANFKLHKTIIRK